MKAFLSVALAYALLCSCAMASAVVPARSSGASQDSNQNKSVDQNSGQTEEKPYSPKEVTTKAVIKKRPAPKYTKEARKHSTSGSVVLRAVLSSDGQVKDIRAVVGLPYGLTERAIEAARKIKFVPAIKDGHAVSQYVQIEYNFLLF